MKLFFSLFIFALTFSLISAQPNNFQLPLSINSDGSAPDGSAILDINSTDKGILIPRLLNTAAISSPVEGLMIYQTEAPKGFYYYDGADWKSFGAPSPFVLENLTEAERDALTPVPGMMIYNSDTGRPEDYRMYPVFGPVANNGNIEPGCSSIAQSFKPNTSTSITDIVTKVSFGGNVGYVTLNITKERA